MKKIFQYLPDAIKTVARTSRANIPWTKIGGQRRWVSETYSKFGLEERRRIFLSIARFHHINRPVPGYYFEFGCNEANTMRMAWDSFHYLFDRQYVGFDSFAGLPAITEIDKQEIWEKGKLAYDEQLFINQVISNGMPREKLITVKGFYEDTLTDELAAKFVPQKASVVYIDCDLYTSTVPILKWIPQFLQVGTVIVFDDWNCFKGDPSRGERRAWHEFSKEHSDIGFEPFVSTGEAQSFICIRVG